ncbi:DUF4817 domain-containing protein [Trichonephila clavipes]|uniref:DUF4817 domain-containing protein n=1 Tax=Trichonephila clavipes TaxID=2585209 RepID=A0A8X6RLH4_TRICX|nr:DUF4817 domain-containing protein [Trichonephila clavipes]
MNPASMCPRTIIEDVSGDSQGSVPIFLSVLHATKGFNKLLWSGNPSFEDGSFYSSLEENLQQIAYQTLPWSARSPDPSPIKHVWDMMGRRLHLPGYVDDLLDTGRQRTTRTVDAEDRVLQELDRNPSTSTRVVSRETHIPQATVWRIAHDEGLHPYHLQRVQALELGDYSKRMNFARWFLHESNAERNFAASALFTDEATFSLEGVMNFHNLHTWADENTHAIRPHGAQRKCSINVWAGIVGDCLLGPYILPERLNGSVYITFLQEVLPEMLNDVPMTIRQRIRFQHDGAPAHFSIDVRAHLQAIFPGGWIGRGGLIAWPARSPDLSHLDFSYGDF